MRREFVEPATVPRDLLDALEDVAKAANGLRFWANGCPRSDTADALTAALARLSAARQTKEDV